MIDARSVHNQVRRKLNRINSNYSNYIGVPDLDEYLNEALQVWVKNKSTVAEINSSIRNDLSEIEIKDHSLKFSQRKGKVVAELPKDYLKGLRRIAKATLDDCKSKTIKIEIVRSDEVENLLDNPYKTPNFMWGETIGDEAHDGLHIWTDGEFTIEEVIIDYIRKPKEIRCPSLLDSGSYTIGSKIYSVDQGLELTRNYQVNEITDLATLFVLRDISDSQEYQTQIDKILRTITTYLN